MRMKIQSWYDGSAVDKDFHAESANYIVHVGARSFDRMISDRESSVSFQGEPLPAGGSPHGRKGNRAKGERW
jgi:hypothetical protein